MIKRLIVSSLAFSGVTLFTVQPVIADSGHVQKFKVQHEINDIPIQLGANMDLLAAGRDFGPAGERQTLQLREVEVSLEAQIKPWLYGMVFLTRPEGEAFDIEEAAAIATLPMGVKLKAGMYRNEFGLLNTIHEPERPQVSLPLPISEFLGDEQLREGAVTLGKKFNLDNNHRAAASLAVLNGDNEVAFNAAQSSDYAYSGKLYYGYQASAYRLQLGLSSVSGKNNAAANLDTRLHALDFNFMLQPGYASQLDYPARFMLIGEFLSNRRELSTDSSNTAQGYWSVADFQFLPAHHAGIGVEYAENILDNSQTSQATSAHYSWYYDRHTRLQLQARKIEGDTPNTGYEVQLQWNVSLAPHSERPFLDLFGTD